ncbi:hypothetical protein [Lysobacter gummosus]|uniref:hypothetical protein n=1 Tax=Lysobacter gummosus TaxID=262324 RepID=UPI00364062A3
MQFGDEFGAVHPGTMAGRGGGGQGGRRGRPGPGRRRGPGAFRQPGDRSIPCAIVSTTAPRTFAADGPGGQAFSNPESRIPNPESRPYSAARTLSGGRHCWMNARQSSASSGLASQ